ncbi:PDDEXK nuclease domain-containing protein [Chitinophaga filiformis]|uniref:PDDEXK nuclease domain-containing protein n=1 Tax=Chitinophaga filiformis TaxID=104663 RepID=A0ABY4HYW9_CHIFI|nr:PDDEXK nuclease domain-containing protein [Chitinophaga filiformis]UPK69019.1 PDDEXK nuclease domain-containing protein [Chitinophaga filiformis]
MLSYAISQKYQILPFNKRCWPMYACLNYYKEIEMHESDNQLVGIIRCASKNENLVGYMTSGLPQQVFMSKYLINLPGEDELAKDYGRSAKEIGKV